MDLAWLDTLERLDYTWEYRNPPTAEQELEKLERFIERPLPEGYRALLRRINGGGLRYRDYWYFRFLGIAEIPEQYREA